MVSSIRINTSNFNESMIFLVKVLGFKITGYEIDKNGNRFAYLAADLYGSEGLELMISEDPIACEQSPVQFGIRSRFCSLSDSMQALNLKGLRTETLHEANKRLGTDYPEYILFKDSRFVDFFLDSRLQSKNPSGISTDEFLHLLHIEGEYGTAILGATQCHAIYFKRLSIDNYLLFFDLLGIHIWDDHYKDFACMRFDSNGNDIILCEDQGIGAGIVDETVISLRAKSRSELQHTDILNYPVVDAVDMKYTRRYTGLDIYLEVINQDRICWEIEVDTNKKAQAA
jgi:hypothetical protein